jgi:hypothetical protein
LWAKTPVNARPAPFKELIATQTRTVASEIKLKRGLRVLKDDRTLEDYRVYDGSVGATLSTPADA